MCKVGVEPNCRGMGFPTTTVFRRVALLLTRRRARREKGAGFPHRRAVEIGKQHERRKAVKAVARPLLLLYDIISPNCISLYFTVIYCTLLALSSSSSAAHAFLFVFQHHSWEYPISSAMSSMLILPRCLKSRNSSHCGGS